MVAYRQRRGADGNRVTCLADLVPAGHGSLAATALSVLPVWTSFDPLPVLDLAARDARAKNERMPAADDGPADDAVETVFE